MSRHEFALEWMADFEAYSAALEADASYAATLSRSLSLVLEEFYDGMRCVGLSALTGEGMDELFKVRSVILLHLSNVRAASCMMACAAWGCRL